MKIYKHFKTKEIYNYESTTIYHVISYLISFKNISYNKLVKIFS